MGYEFWIARNPGNGQIRYVFANFRSPSRRKTLESVLQQRGVDPSRVVVIDHSVPYERIFRESLHSVQPDIVIVGGLGISGKAESAGAAVNEVTVGTLTSKVFSIVVGGEKKVVLVTSHPYGALSKDFTRALIDLHQTKPVKFVFMGDSGSLGRFREILDDLNPSLGIPRGTMIPKDDMCAPSRFRTSSGEIIEHENPIAQLLERRGAVRGREGKVTLHTETTHTNAFSPNEEDIGYLVDEVSQGADSVDVEGSFVVEAVDEARREGKDVPEVSLIFHVSDDVGVGRPLSRGGHGYHAIDAKNKLVIEHLTGSPASQLDVIKTVPEPRRVKLLDRVAAGFEEIPGPLRGQVGRRVSQLKNEGKTFSEIRKIIDDEFPELTRKTISIDDIVEDTLRPITSSEEIAARQAERKPDISNVVRLGEDANGQTFYIKQTSEISARAERVADSFFQRIGFGDQNPVAFTDMEKGVHIVATREVAGSREAVKGDLRRFMDHSELRQKFLFDAYLGNYDTSANNWLVVTVRNADGTTSERLVAIDAGAALDSTSGGVLKPRVRNPAEPHEFYNPVGFTEDDLWEYYKLMSQRNPIYKAATHEDLVEAARRIGELGDEDIAQIVDSFAVTVTTEGALSRDELVTAMIRRRDDVRRLLLDDNRIIADFPRWVGKRTNMDKLTKKISTKVSKDQPTAVDDILRDYPKQVQKEEMWGILQEMLDQGKLVEEDGMLKVAP